MTDTQMKAADLVQEAARQGKIAIYIESLPSGDYRLIMPDGDYGMYAELLYKSADRCAEQNMNPYAGHVRLRD